ncbi:uridine diphosphate glucose pyrophosphatase NUDT22 [Caerostris darwini]|uniref:Uridine diphosphate glucose pyrophosphatase NUDT22 n=1 Tax=Caerostris darwini TaxID=1538125 RepID=A0AAV4WSH9_9ARAC|nr:uridine diphosphate glucose pyrophosphatase NUDT22 [Caerostris darwini]
MELTDNLTILCTPGHGLDQSSVEVEWRAEYGRKTLPFINKAIENEWDKKMKVCAALWNGTKFRLHKIELWRETTSNFPRVKLFLGPTCYKDFIGTNCVPESKQLIQKGIQEYGNSQAYLSDPLGNGALIVTRDNNIIFMRRSKQCAEFPFMIDRPGGHPEPDDVINKAEKTNLQDVDSSMLLEELFDSVLKEVTEEINIPSKNLASPILLGVSYNPITLKTPSLEFYVRCNLSTVEIIEYYKTRYKGELDEAFELIIISVKEILENDLEKLEFYDQLTFAAKAILFLFKIFSL